MMKIAVVGGALQGLEILYLAQKAGWESLLIDRRADPPARQLCHRFKQLDITAVKALGQEMAGVDLIFPALEDQGALNGLGRWASEAQAPLVFDPAAYAISSSKLASERFLKRHRHQTPRSWPEADFPLIAKPDRGSGSRGIQILHSAEEKNHLGIQPQDAHQWLLQEYLTGPTFSVEVWAGSTGVEALQVTDLEMDAGFDCKRVTAPSRLSMEQVSALKKMAIAMAAQLDLSGLMDLEVILHEGRFRVLEFDARFPSQTPVTVFWSCGLNMVRMAKQVESQREAMLKLKANATRGVIYEHIQVTPGMLTVVGEHVLAQAKELKVFEGFFGADEAISDYRPGKPDWVATLINCGPDLRAAWEQRNIVLGELCRHFDIDRVRDPQPPPIRPEVNR